MAEKPPCWRAGFSSFGAGLPVRFLMIACEKFTKTLLITAHDNIRSNVSYRTYRISGALGDLYTRSPQPTPPAKAADLEPCDSLRLLPRAVITERSKKHRKN